MLNFHTILFVAVTVAFPTVSAIPASAIGNGLTNFLPAVGLPSKAILSDLPIGVVNDAATDDGFPGSLDPQVLPAIPSLANPGGIPIVPSVVKRGFPSCGEIIKNFHDDIVVIVIKIG